MEYPPDGPAGPRGQGGPEPGGEHGVPRPEPPLAPSGTPGPSGAAGVGVPVEEPGGPPAPAILLAGPGRAGSSLALAWHRAGGPVAWVTGRRDEPARRLAAQVGARTIGWQRLLAEGLPGPWPPVVVLAVADRAVAEAAARLAGRLEAVPEACRPRYALHLSGALGLEPLAPLARLGLATEVFHPLLPLPGGPAAGRDHLAGGYATVVYDPGQNRAPVGPVLARGLGATPVLWPGATARQLALYHAAATLAANGVTALLWAARELLRLSGYPGMAMAARVAAGRDPGPGAGPGSTTAAGSSWGPLEALARAALEAAAERGPLAALTGPIVRGDAATVQRHLEALAGGAGTGGGLGAFDPGPAGRYRLAATLVLAAASARPGDPPAGLEDIARLLGAGGEGAGR